MEKQRWHKIEEIVDVALDIHDKDERTKFITEKCNRDETLIKEVLDFIHSIEASDGLWDDLLNSNRVIADDMYSGIGQSKKTGSEEQPEMIGPYRIKKVIAQGGMGNIYLAERAGVKFHKKVALKIIRREIDSAVTIQRFIQERSILSALSHPNIARLLDGGVTDDGRPYFVMEFLDGLPITTYCKENRCTIKERLRLFANVCRAVQYAHSNFVVHRDLKPSNILVTSDGDLKILDFGIAKLTDGKLTDETLIETRAGYRMLSLNYAAPEQITSEPVTTATDVYALGLLLFELLSESKAFDLEGKNLVEIEQVIRNREPLKPSEINNEWKELLKGDLDAIVLKAIRKEPGQRYESASHFLEDLERYVNNLPVKARKGTTRYKTSKFIKRHKSVLASITVLFLVITTMSVLYAHRINQEKLIAESEAQKADQVSKFLIELFQGADPFNEHSSFGLNTSIGTILDIGSANVDEELKDQPEVRAAIKGVIGEVYYSLDEFGKAIEFLNEAVSISLSEEIESGLPSYYFSLGKVYQSIGDADKADSLLSLSIQLFEDSPQGFTSTDAVAALSLYGNFLWFNKGDFQTAEAYLHRSLEQRQLHYSDSDYIMASVYNDLATLNHAQGKFSNAEEFYKNAIRLYTRLDSLSPSTAITMSNFSMLLRERGNLEDAKMYQQEALDIVLLLGDQHELDIALGYGNLSEINMRQGNYMLADSLSNESIDLFMEIFGGIHPYIVRTELVQAESLYRQGKLEEAESQLLRIYEDYKTSYPENHPRLGDPALVIGKLYKAKGDTEKAKEYLNLAYTTYLKGYGYGNPKTGDAMVQLGNYMWMEGNTEAADSLLTKGYEILIQSLHSEDERIAEAETIINRYRN